jgi:hypothetical protein
MIYRRCTLAPTRVDTLNDRYTIAPTIRMHGGEPMCVRMDVCLLSRRLCSCTFASCAAGGRLESLPCYTDIYRVEGSDLSLHAHRCYPARRIGVTLHGMQAVRAVHPVPDRWP